MTDIDSVLIIDSLNVNANITSRFFRKFSGNVKTITDLQSLDCLDESFSLILISTYVLRQNHNVDFQSKLKSSEMIIGLTPSQILPKENELFRTLGIIDYIELPLVDTSYDLLLSMYHSRDFIFDLSGMISRGLSVEDAIETAELAIPELYEKTNELLVHSHSYGLKQLIEKIHSIHGLVNYCGLVKIKSLMNALELDFKELRDNNSVHTSSHLKSLNNVLKKIISHLDTAKNAIKNNLLKSR